MKVQVNGKMRTIEYIDTEINVDWINDALEVGTWDNVYDDDLDAWILDEEAFDGCIDYLSKLSNDFEDDRMRLYVDDERVTKAQ